MVGVRKKKRGTLQRRLRAGGAGELSEQEVKLCIIAMAIMKRLRVR